MPTRKLLLLSGLCTFVFGAGAALGQGPNLGRPISPADITAWDIDIEPSGAGLPAGSGTTVVGNNTNIGTFSASGINVGVAIGGVSFSVNSNYQ